jgi:hypothetical protein
MHDHQRLVLERACVDNARSFLVGIFLEAFVCIHQNLKRSWPVKR